MTEYFTIKVPRVLANQIEEVAIKNSSYRTVSEFVLESARRRLDDIIASHQT
jgi:uncharacterized protein (DUF1778 family)